MNALRRNSQRVPLNNNQLSHLAPAIFADAPAQQVSDKYKFIPTIQVIDILRNQGWNPVQAFTSRVRDENREGFQKHSVRFAREDGEMIAGDSKPEILLTNSHDAKCAYQIHAALFRMVCSNGMVVADTTFEKVAIRHQNFEQSDVIDASYRVIEQVPQIAAAVEGYKSLELTEEQQLAFASAAIKLKWADTGKEPIIAQDLLQTRRYADNGKNLWHTYNTVQENLLKGGIYAGRSKKTGRRQRTRKVGSINEDIRLNKALWTLTDEMSKLVKG